MPAPPHCDPAQGVFETLLVVGGQPIELGAHLERLGNSLGALFDADLPEDALDKAHERARRIDLGRLRLTASPQRRGVAIRAEAEEVEAALVVPAPPLGVSLRSLEVEGGFGEHKWADRRLLERAEAEVAPAVPLLLDSDGSVLEASRANVFALRDGELVTPPTDGRIVPGIARRRVVEAARAAGRRVREEPLSTAELLTAEEVFLTNSIRGVQPVHTIDATPLPSADVPRLNGPNADATRGTSPGGGVAGVGGVGDEGALRGVGGGEGAGAGGRSASGRSAGGVTGGLAEGLRRDWLGPGAPAAAAAGAP